MSHVLVTGAAGCIGAWVVKHILDRGGDPVVQDLCGAQFDTRGRPAQTDGGQRQQGRRRPEPARGDGRHDPSSQVRRGGGGTIPA